MTSWLAPEQARPFAHLTTASLAVALDGLVVPTAQAPTPADALFAAGQTFAGLPAALAVVKQTTHDALEVISLAVAEPFRRLGLARQLLLWLQAEAKRLGLQSLSLSYPLGHASTAAMERLTRGWHHSPGLRLVHFDRAGAEAVVQPLAPLAARWQRSSRFALVRWQDIDADLQCRLELLQQQAPSWAWSAAADAALGQRDVEISQVLLDREAVVGWLVAHRVGLSLFRVTQWWVAPEWRGRGLAVLLLYQAIAESLNAHPPYESFCFGVGAGSEEMLKICRRRLEPLASTVQANQRVSWMCP
ncbi:MAG: GNAT family N-acetyltransferase [Cyanobacteria bacterium M_surface_9_m1_291]|nr:GNAT family N-acetyltransferase [Cyanobacteria bacterium M_surface_9_m1_291]